MAHLFGTQGKANMANKAKTCPLYVITHRKPQTQNKKYSQCELENFPNP